VDHTKVMQHTWSMTMAAMIAAVAAANVPAKAQVINLQASFGVCKVLGTGSGIRHAKRLGPQSR